MRSVHGLLSWIWQPKVLAKHQVVTKTQLETAYKNAGLIEVEGNYCGLFSLNIVAWGVEPRWPRIEKVILPFIHKAVRRSDAILRRLKGFDKSVPFLSPFIYVIGRKT